MGDATDIADRLSGRVADLVRGRRVILAGTVAAAWTPFIDRLRELGAGPFLVVATGTGTGPLPEGDDVEKVVHEVDAADMIDDFRQIERLLHDPPTAFVEAVERFDPRRGALVLFPPYSSSQQLCGRPAYGARRPAWVAVEDKTTCDALFDRVGVRRAPSEVVPVERAALLAAAARLDEGIGTVWAGDARAGFNGGGVFVRWIRPSDGAAVDEAITRFAPACDEVRVAPFVEGIPCSVHGVACGDGIAALRPVELVNLRPPGRSQLQYAGAATFFDPPPEDREEMREAARRIGRLLVDEHGFAGTFTVDGILGADGWVPTEVNPRFGAGIGYAGALHPDLPFALVHQMLIAGDLPDVAAADIEALLLPAADETRWGGGWSVVPTRFDTNDSVPVRRDGDRLVVAGDDEEPDGRLLRGPNPVGGYVRLNLDAARTPSGPSIAPTVVAALALADELWGAGIGPLDAPKTVR